MLLLLFVVDDAFVLWTGVISRTSMVHLHLQQ